MAQLPSSMRRRKPATTSIHEKPPELKTKLIEWGSWVVLFLAIVVLLIGSYALYQRLNTAKIANVYVVGVPQVSQNFLIHHLQDDTQGSYFTTDLEKIRDRTLDVPWVDRVVVSRAWPDSIVIRVTPRHAVARWGTGRLLSDDGVVFQSIQPVNTQHLPLLYGPSSQSRMMMTKYRDINQMFAPKGLRLKELHLTERMTWFMQFDNGLRLIVDQDQTMSKLQRLSELSVTDLSAMWDKIAAVDLRYRNGLVLQWKNVRPPLIKDGKFVIVPQVSEVTTAPAI